MAEQLNAADDGLHIDPDAVFADRVTIARARASEVLGVVRALSNVDQPIRSTRENEMNLRDLEASLSSALHFAGQLKRAILR